MNFETWKTGRRGQILAVGIGAIALMIAWLIVINPAVSWFTAREMHLAHRREVLLHAQGLAAALPALKTASVQAQRIVADLASIMLTDDSDAVAAASLQEQVQTVAAQVGTTLAAVDTLPSAVATIHQRRITLRVSVSAPWPVLIALLSGLRQSPTRIVVESVHFRATPFSFAPGTTLPIQAVVTLHGISRLR